MVSSAEIHAVDIVDSDDYHTLTAVVVAVGLMLAVAVVLVVVLPVAAVRSFDDL